LIHKDSDKDALRSVVTVARVVAAAVDADARMPRSSAEQRAQIRIAATARPIQDAMLMSAPQPWRIIIVTGKRQWRISAHVDHQFGVSTMLRESGRSRWGP